MTDLNSLIPSDSGWVLELAFGFDGGKILGFGMIDELVNAHAFGLRFALEQVRALSR